MVLTVVAIVIVVLVLGAGVLAAGLRDRSRPRVDQPPRAGQAEPPATGPIRPPTRPDGFLGGGTF